MQFASLVENLKAPGSAAWDIHFEALERHSKGEDVIVLSVGDPDMDTPRTVVDTAIDAINAGDTHYTEVAGRMALREAIAALYRRRYQITAGAENVTVVAGAQNGLFACSLCLLEKGDDVLVPDPMYVTYGATLSAGGARVVAVPTRAENGFRADPEDFRKALTPRTKAIFLANPSNPTGAVIERPALEEIAKLAAEHDLWLVVDEVYESLVYEGQFASALEFEALKDRIVVIGSLSKSHAMTGWRAGWVISNSELAEHIERLALNMTYGLPGFIQQAALKAVEAYDPLSTETREIYHKRRDAFLEALKDCPNVMALSPNAGMFILLDVRATGLTSHEFSWKLLHEAGVSVLDGAAFGPATDGFVRASFVCSAEKLQEAGQRIRRFAQTLAASKAASAKPQAASPIVAEAKPQDVSKVTERVHADRIQKCFGDLEVLRDVSLKANEGDVISLIGASGSGKSTLLRCINLLEVPNSGNLYIDREEVKIARGSNGEFSVSDPAQLRRIRTKLAMVFQNFNLWPHRTVLENLIEAPMVVLGEKRKTAEERALGLLERVGLAEKRDAYPHHLSGGQQQRVAIARALAMEPEVMLFDEPTSALDPELVGEVLRVIRSLAEEGRTMILVTHEMAFARDVSSQVMFLHQGVVEEKGTPRQVFENPKSERCQQFVNAQFNR